MKRIPAVLAVLTSTALTGIAADPCCPPPAERCERPSRWWWQDQNDCDDDDDHDWFCCRKKLEPAPIAPVVSSIPALLLAQPAVAVQPQVAAPQTARSCKPSSAEQMRQMTELLKLAAEVSRESSAKKASAPENLQLSRDDCREILKSLSAIDSRMSSINERMDTLQSDIDRIRETQKPDEEQ